MVNRKLFGALKISAIYLIAGCIWIISSDTILGILIPDADEYAVYQTYKGWAFILSSAVLLFILLYSEFKKRDIIESDLIKNLHEKKILLNEVHHRVKNNLNSIISLLYIEKSKAGSTESIDMIETLSGRIFSMALVHEHLYKTADFKEINLKKYIPELIDSIKGNFLLNEDKVEVKYNMDETVLDITKAIPVGILLNEIISNSFKHAFPDSKQGIITVDVKLDRGRCLLTVGDNGVGDGKAADKYSGDGPGIELIKMLVRQLSGEISCDNTAGYKYDIVFPVSN